MPIADDWSINYVTKQIYQANWQDEITGSSASVAEIQTVLCLLKTSITVATYFNLYSAKDETAYYVWYDKTGSDTDPAVAGKTGIRVNISADTTAIEVASRTVTAIAGANSAKDFTASNGGTATVTITNVSKGSTTNASNGTLSPTFTFGVTTNGVGETVFSVNALYSHLQDTFDELGQMDDKVPMSAQTPTDYTIINSWFVDEVSLKYLTGGALKSDGWATGEIIQQLLPTGYTDAVASDLGKVVTEADTGDTGTLLFADNTRKKWWIKPDVAGVAGDYFDDAGSAYAITAGTGAGTSTAPSTSGENLWANVYTLGTIQTSPSPQIYIFQNGASISEWSTLSNWDRGQIDVLLRVKEAGSEIDGANITVFARQGGNSYDHFSIDLTSGGRNAVPLSTATDLNYTSGDYYLLYDTEVSGPFTAGEVIKHNATPSLWSAQLVSITDWGTSGVLKLTNVNGTPVDNHAFKGQTSLATGQVNGTLGDTYGTSSAEGTQLTIGLVCTGGTSGAKHILRGIQDDGSTSKYVFQVSTSAVGVARTPYFKDFTSGETITDTSTGSITSGSASATIVSGWTDITVAFVNGTATFNTGSGSFTYGEKVTFTGGSGIVLYNTANGSATGTLTIGNMTITAISGLTITGAISGATVVATQNLQSTHFMSKNFNQQSSFSYDVIINAGDIYNAGRTFANVYEYLKFINQENSIFQMYTVVSAVITPLDGEEYIQAYTGYTPVKSAPFGTFAGGTFFGAQSVWVEGLAIGQSYSFLDNGGVTRAPYASITITVSSVVSGDRVTVFRTSGGLVDKNLYQSHTSSNTLGATAIITDGTPTITTDTPDSGIVRVVDVSLNTEHRFRYVSWTGSTFTLVTLGIPSGTAILADVTGRTLRATNANLANILPGDLIRNTTDVSWAHVISVTLVSGSTYDVLHTPLQGGTLNTWVISDGYSFNNLPVVYTASDTIYIPFLDETASSTTVSKIVLYDTVNGNKAVLVRVRKKGILPFETSGTVTTSGLSVAAIRTADSIVT